MAAVLRDAAGAAERQAQVADGLVGQLAGRGAEHVLVDQGLGLGPLVLEHQLPDPPQRRCASGVALVVRPARPDGVLVELQPLGVGAAEHHGAQAAVADRQRSQPVRTGALVVPQGQVAGGAHLRRGRRGGPGGGRPGQRHHRGSGTGRAEPQHLSSR